VVAIDINLYLIFIFIAAFPASYIGLLIKNYIDYKEKRGWQWKAAHLLIDLTVWALFFLIIQFIAIHIFKLKV